MQKILISFACAREVEQLANSDAYRCHLISIVNLGIEKYYHCLDQHYDIDIGDGWFQRDSIK